MTIRSLCLLLAFLAMANPGLAQKYRLEPILAIDDMPAVPSHALLNRESTVTFDAISSLKDRDIFQRLLSDPDLQKKILDLQKDPSKLDEVLNSLPPEFRDVKKLTEMKEKLEGRSNSLGGKPTETTSSSPLNKLLDGFNGLLNKSSGKSTEEPKIDVPRKKPGLTSIDDAIMQLDFNRPNPKKEFLASLPRRSDFKPSPNLMRWFQENLAGRPEWNDFLKDLNLKISKNEWQQSDWYKNFEGEAKDLAEWAARQNFRVPRTNFRSAGRLSGNFELPGFVGGIAGQASTGSSWIMPIIVIGGAGLAIWFLKSAVKKPPEIPVENKFSRWDLSIQVDEVTDAGKFVAAYDRLSLRYLGEKAIHWNHQKVENEIREREPQLAENINMLTELYERARYSKLDAPLSETDLTSARRAIRTLLEVSAK